MIYKLIVTGKARKHLENSVDYLLFQIQNKQAAQRLLKETKSIYGRLKSNPEQFPYCQDQNLRNKNYRKAVLSTMNYSVIFKIEETQVFVIGIFHDSENYSDKL